MAPQGSIYEGSTLWLLKVTYMKGTYCGSSRYHICREHSVAPQGSIYVGSTLWLLKVAYL